MEIELKKLLEGTLVVPYSNEEIERLEKVCEALKDEFESVYKAQNEESISLPRSVFEALAAYTIYKAVGKGDIVHQLALLNSMIVMNGRWEHLSFADLFAYCVEKSLAAVDGKADIGEENDTDLLKQIFEGQELEGQSIDSEMHAAMKSLARDAWYHRMQELLGGENMKQYNTYTKVYVGLTKIVDSMPWTFLNQRVLQQIHDLAPRTSTKDLTVSEIVEQVRPLYDTKRELSSHSSILLHMMADEDFEGNKWTFASTSLSVRSFAVYLYYELMLEKYFD